MHLRRVDGSLPSAHRTHLNASHLPLEATASYTVLGWSVTDIDATIDDLAARGVSFTRYEGMDQDERGVWTAPGGSRTAWFLDPDGNNLLLTEFAHPD